MSGSHWGPSSCTTYHFGRWEGIETKLKTSIAYIQVSMAPLHLLHSHSTKFKPVTFPLGALQGSVSKTWIQLGPNSASRRKKNVMERWQWLARAQEYLIRYPKSHSVIIQKKKNHSGYRNAARLIIEVKASVIFQMHITNWRKRKVKIISIKQKLDIVENRAGKWKDITNQ